MLFYLQVFLVLYQFYQASKTNKEKLEAATLDDSAYPKATEATVIPIGYGTYELTGYNCLWYGAYSTFTIQSKEKTGGFFGIGGVKQDVSTGYRTSMQMGLGWGGEYSTINLLGMKIDDKYFYKNTTEGSYSGYVDNKEFFGDYRGGAGGLEGNFSFYAGDKLQTSDPFLVAQLGDNVPYFNNFSHMVIKNFYIGNGNSIAPWTFVLKRILKFPWAVGTRNEINGSCNPISIIYDILTNDFYGIALTDDNIDLNNFRTAHDTCFNEGLGVSFVVNDSKSTLDILSDIFSVIDGQFNLDFVNGKFQIKLNRKDYVIADLIELNESNVLELSNYNRGTLTSKINEIKLKYTDIANDFAQKYAIYQDQGSIFENYRPDPKIIDYSLVTDPVTAQKLCDREALPLTNSLVKVDLEVTRVASGLQPGDVVKLNWPKLFIKQLILRVLEVDYGDYSGKSSVKLSLIEDKFSLNSTLTYNPVPVNNWTPINYTALAADLRVEEAPYYFSTSTDQNKVITYARKPSSAHINYLLNTKTGTNDYIQTGISNGFTPVGTVNAAFDELVSSITLVNDSNISNIESYTTDTLLSGYNFALIVEGTKKEFINFSTVSVAGSIYTISGVNRALFDTIPQSFTSAAKIYFLSYGFAMNNDQTYANGANIRLKAVTKTANDTLLLSAAPEVSYTLTNRKSLPIAVSNLIINTQKYKPIITTAKENLKLSWSNRDKKSQTIQYYNDTVTSNVDNNQYNIKIYNNQTGTLYINVTQSAMSYEFTTEFVMNMLYNPQLRVEITTINNSIESLYKYVIIVNRV